MLLDRLVETSRAVQATRRRKEKVERLAHLLRGLEGDERTIGAHLLAGSLRQGRIGIGHATVARTTRVPAAPAPKLSLVDVDRALSQIVDTAGQGSAKRRLAQLEGLLARATRAEQDFLRRVLVGEIRQGALEGVLVEAAAAATGLDPARVRRARMLSGDLALVVQAALTEGARGLERFQLSVFTPVHPMLASTAAGVEDALTKLGEAALEWKLDGARVQIHRSGEEVRVYSRRLNEVTAAVPEVVELARRLPVRSGIWDGETLALGPQRRPLPFQATMRRYGRKLDVERLRAELPLSTFLFDALLLDDEPLVDLDGEARHERLAIAPASVRIPRTVTGDPELADAFVADALATGHEGVMAKSLRAPYEAGRRGAGWLKLKPAHTLDLVVIAVEWGSGRRQGWLSNLHLACRDATTGELVMLGKTFKGLTDELLAWQTQALLQREIRREGHVVHVRPELVVEIALDGIQQSPHYPGGLALRFARVKRYRADKSPGEASTLAEVRVLADGRASEEAGRAAPDGL